MFAARYNSFVTGYRIKPYSITSAPATFHFRNTNNCAIKITVFFGHFGGEGRGGGGGGGGRGGVVGGGFFCLCFGVGGRGEGVGFKGVLGWGGGFFLFGGGFFFFFFFGEGLLCF